MRPLPGLLPAGGRSCPRGTQFGPVTLEDPGSLRGDGGRHLRAPSPDDTLPPDLRGTHGGESGPRDGSYVEISYWDAVWGRFPDSTTDSNSSSWGRVKAGASR